MVISDECTRALAVFFAAQARRDRQISLTPDDAPDPLVTQCAANGGFVEFLPPLHSGIHIHLQLEVHTAAQIQTQLHGLTAQVAEPFRRSRRQVQCHNEAVAQGALHPRLRDKLLLRIAETHQRVATARINNFAEMLNAGLFQRAGDAAESALVDDLGAALPRDLQGRIRRVQVGRGIEQADRQHSQHQEIFPQWILIQHNQALTGDRASASALVAHPCREWKVGHYKESKGGHKGPRQPTQ